MSEWNLDLGYQSHSDLHSLLGHDLALRLDRGNDTFAILVDAHMRLDAVLCRAQLNNLILENCIANLMPSHLSKPVDCGDAGILNIELNFNVAAINMLILCGSLGPTDDLKRVPHVRSDEQVARVDLQHGEHLYANHL